MESEAAVHDINAKAVDLYLNLLKKCLTRYLFPEGWQVVDPPRGTLKWALGLPILLALRRKGYQIVRPVAFDARVRAEGRDWPLDAETMVGLMRLDNVHKCVWEVLRRGVPGDLMECGIWRGGVTIFMRACLEAYGDNARRVWVADSFRGLPKPRPELFPADEGMDLWKWNQLVVTSEQVKLNFSKYGLLDDRVVFLEGWFRDTLPFAPIERLAVLRIDADLYESTMDALVPLYPKVSPGGYVIVDDYYSISACKQAVDDFRTTHRIREPLERVDWSAAFWMKED